MKTVVGLFDTYAHAEIAAHDLERVGILHDDISLLANNTAAEFGPMDETQTTHQADTEAEAGKGAVAGGVAGLLLGLAAIAIPGLGIVAAVGWLTTTVAGAVVGAGVGVVGALNGVGVPHEEAAYYNEGVRRGGTLLAVRVQDNQITQVEQILSADGAVNINERAEQYRQEGFVPPAPDTFATPPATSAPAPALNSAVTPPEPPVAVNNIMSATTRDLKPQTTRRAYELYEQRGHRDGHALDDWLDAERELQSNAVGRTNAEATPV